MTRMQTDNPDSAGTQPRRHPLPGWLHLCNGLDPVRDGGMVPSILGMTGALAGWEATSRSSRPRPRDSTPGRSRRDCDSKGPETDLEAAVRSAEVVHMHGLWQEHTRRGARAARAAGVPYLIAAHGMAEPWALRHKRWKKRLYLALVEVAESSPRSLPARAVAARDRPPAPARSRTPICFVPNGVDLAPSTSHLPATSRTRAKHPELEGKFVLLFFGRVHVKKGLDLLAEALGQLAPELPRAAPACRRQGRRRLEPVLRADRAAGLSRARHLAGPRRRRACQPGLGSGRRLHPAQLQRGLQHGDPRGSGLLAPLLDHHRLPLPRAGRGRRGHRRRAPDSDAVTQGLRELLERTDRRSPAAGQNGRRLVESSTPGTGRPTARLGLRWLAGGGAPECVVP